MLFQIADHTVWSKATLAGTTHHSWKGKRACEIMQAISVIPRISPNSSNSRSQK